MILQMGSDLGELVSPAPHGPLALVAVGAVVLALAVGVQAEPLLRLFFRDYRKLVLLVPRWE
jgi:hypothetical protein